MKNNLLTSRTEAKFISSENESEALIDGGSENQFDDSATPICLRRPYEQRRQTSKLQSILKIPSILKMEQCENNSSFEAGLSPTRESIVGKSTPKKQNILEIALKWHFQKRLSSLSLAFRLNQKGQNQKMFFDIIESHEGLENDKTMPPTSIEIQEGVSPKQRQSDDLIDQNGHFNDQDVENVDTGIQTSASFTRFPIMEGFMVHGDHIVFLTLDVVKNQVMLEVFQFIQKRIRPRGIIELCNRDNFDTWNAVLDSQRKNISFFMFSWQTYKIDNQDSKRQICGYFINTKILLTEPNKECVFEYDSQQLNEVEENLQIAEVFQVLSEESSSSHLYALQLALVRPNLNHSYQMNFFNLKINTQLLNTHKVQDLSFKLTRSMTEQKQLVGFFEFQKTQTIAVFDNGELVVFQNDHQKQSIILQLPFQKTSNVKMTFYNYPRLILQGSNKEIVGFEYINNQWTQSFMFKNMIERLEEAYGNFVIVSNQDGSELSLLEPSKDLTSPIATYLSLGTSQSKNMSCDAVSPNYSSFLRFSKSGKNFDFQCIIQNRFVYHSKVDQLQQVCSNYVVSLQKDLQFIFLEKGLDKLQKTTRIVEVLEIKNFENDIKAKSFVPYLCPKSQYLLIVIQPEISASKLHMEHQYFLMVNHRKNKVFPCRTAEGIELPIKKFLFTSKSTLFCQNSVQIFECQLMETEKGFILELVKDGLRFAIGNSRMLAFAYIENEGKGSILLTKDKSLTFRNEKNIFQIDVAKLREVIPMNRLGSETEKKRTEVKPIEDFLSIAWILSTRTDEFNEVFSNLSLQRVHGCYHPDSKTIFAIVASGDFAVLFKIKQDFNIGETIKFSQAVALQEANRIFVINSEQIAILSKQNLVVIRHNEDEIIASEIKSKLLLGSNTDFKIFLQKQILEFTTSKNTISLIYGKQSLLVDVGQPVSFLQQSESEKVESVKSFNELAAIFKRCLLANYKTTGFISLQEEHGNWDNANKYTPINVHGQDFLTLQSRQSHEQGFDDVILSQNLYFDDFNIWEALIRDALVEGRLEINDYQLVRVLTPVLYDNNQNLIHHLSFNKKEKLVEILEMPSVKMFYNKIEHRYPIFFNFFGLSQINLALEATDYESFYILQDLMLAYQDNIKNSYLVNTFLIPALQTGLDVCSLLDSKICSYKLDDDEVEHMACFPEFHKSDKNFIVNYDKSFMDLLHDEEAYNYLYAKHFPVIDCALENNSQVQRKKTKKITPMSKSKNEKLFMIEYIANRYPIEFNVFDTAANQQDVSMLFTLLAETQMTAYFKTGYIQRLIDYQWNSQLKKTYFVVFAAYFLSLVLVFLASNFLNSHYDNKDLSQTEKWEHELKDTKIRFTICLINSIVILCSVGTFELRQMMAQKLDYLKSVWNLNDLLLVISVVSITLLELLYTQEAKFLLKEAIQEAALEAADALLEIQVRLLKPKPKGGGAGAGESTEIIGDDGQPMTLMQEHKYKQLIRIIFVLAILSSFFKVLNVAQIYTSVGFLIKMLSDIVSKSVPFLMFFVYLNLTFSFVTHAIGFRMDETQVKDPFGEFTGFGFWFVPYLFYSLKQSLGDMKVDTFLFLPKPVMYTAWIVWFLLVIINSMIFLNFLISVITEVYEDLREKRVESAYQRKAEILRDLDLVFGDKIDFLPVNILVTRQKKLNIQREEVNQDIFELKQKLNRDQNTIETAIHNLKHELIVRNNENTKVNDRLHDELLEVKQLLLKSIQQKQ